MSTAKENTQRYPILEFGHSQHKRAELLDRRLDQASHGIDMIKMVTGGRAFRKYSALAEEVGLNQSGNLRGMVVSEKWRTVFRHSSEVGEYMENIGYLSTIVSELAKSAPGIEKILGAKDPVVFKGMQLASLAGSIAQKALIGSVPAGAHLIYRSLEGWCMLVGLAGGTAQKASSSGIATLQRADTLVQTTFDTITDTGNQAKAFWWIVDIRTKLHLGSNSASSKEAATPGPKLP